MHAGVERAVSFKKDETLQKICRKEPIRQKIDQKKDKKDKKTDSRPGVLPITVPLPLHICREAFVF